MALALQAARAGCAATLVARHPHWPGGENPRLPGFVLPADVTLIGMDSVRAACDAADAVLLVVPTQTLRATLAMLGHPRALLVCCKGIEIGTGKLPIEMASDILPGVPAAVLTGPNFARDIAIGLPAAAVIAGGTEGLRAGLIDALASTAFRLYGNDDAIGASIGGAAKNVVAIAAGVVSGAGLGENARAALITRGLAEIARLAVALGGRADTVSGLSGLGDLVLTCTGTASRNFALGFALGQGTPLANLLQLGGPAVEGVSTAPALLARAAGLDMPICQAVADLLAGALTVPEAIAALLTRPRRDE